MKKLVASGMAAAFLGLVVLLGSSPLPAQTVAIKGVSFNAQSGLKENLEALVGKDLFVNLRSGKVYQGYVKSVGSGFIHLEKIAGKDFYDSLIRLDDISAVEVKFRDYR